MEKLSFYDVEKAATVTTLAIGDVARASSEDFMLRVHNDSDLYQAKDVTVSITGDDAVQLWLSPDGDQFAASIDLGTIAPGGTSNVFWLRRVTPSAEVNGANCSAALSVTPAEWTDPVDTSTSDNIALSTEN